MSAAASPSASRTAVISLVALDGIAVGARGVVGVHLAEVALGGAAAGIHVVVEVVVHVHGARLVALAERDGAGAGAYRAGGAILIGVAVGLAVAVGMAGDAEELAGAALARGG